MASGEFSEQDKKLIRRQIKYVRENPNFHNIHGLIDELPEENLDENMARIADVVIGMFDSYV